MRISTAFFAISLICLSASSAFALRGDMNCDNMVDVTDIVATVASVLNGSFIATPCGDNDGDGFDDGAYAAGETAMAETLDGPSLCDSAGGTWIGSECMAPVDCFRLALCGDSELVETLGADQSSDTPCPNFWAYDYILQLNGLNVSDSLIADTVDFLCEQPF